nr:hypothetical protein HmN_000724100 [Hymenolepis microstoma]
MAFQHKRWSCRHLHGPQHPPGTNAIRGNGGLSTDNTPSAILEEQYDRGGADTPFCYIVFVHRPLGIPSLFLVNLHSAFQTHSVPPSVLPTAPLLPSLPPTKFLPSMYFYLSPTPTPTHY